MYDIKIAVMSNVLTRRLLNNTAIHIFDKIFTTAIKHCTKTDPATLQVPSVFSPTSYQTERNG